MSRFVFATTGLLVVAVLPAAGGGALDTQIPNRAKVTGAIDAPRELDTLRLRVPERAELRFKVAGKGRLAPDVRLLAPGGEEVSLGSALRTGKRTARLRPLTVTTAGLYRIDVRDRGESTGTYKLAASWAMPKRQPFAGRAEGGGSVFVFDAEEDARLKATLRAADAGATVRFTRLEGPGGLDIPLAGTPGKKHAVKPGRLPRTGRYRLTLETTPPDAAVTGLITLAASKIKPKLDLRGAERRGTGVARTVTRVLDEEGGDVDVPELDADQRVQIDVTGLCVSVPAGSVTEPLSFALRTDDDEIADPLGFAPAGVLVEFDAEGKVFQEPVSVTLPYDVGAFANGDPGQELCVLKRADDGSVFEVPPETYDVDADRGTVTFPTSGFSSFQAFSPPVELVQVAEAGRPNDLAVPPDEDVVYVSTDLLSPQNPAAAVLRYVPGGTTTRFAGGGNGTGDGLNRLAIDLDRDQGFDGVVVSAVAAGAGGEVVVVTGDRSRGASVAYLIRASGEIVRIAGNGTAAFDESLPSRATGLPFCCAADILPGGDVVLVTDAIPFPQSDRVLLVFTGFADVERIRAETVAGGGTVDVEGSDPLDTRLLQPRAVLVDGQGRILVGDRDWLVRFDLRNRTTTTLAGTNFGEQGEDAVGRTLGGVGAPLRTVVTGVLDDLAFAPGREDILYAADPESGIVWRFDLQRDRAFVAAGRRVDFERPLETREPAPDAADPSLPLNFPTAVAPVGDEVLIAELFDFRLFSLRRVDR
jgi:sugar lactone lactonase YvrE